MGRFSPYLVGYPPPPCLDMHSAMWDIIEVCYGGTVLLGGNLKCK